MTYLRKRARFRCQSGWSWPRSWRGIFHFFARKENNQTSSFSSDLKEKQMRRWMGPWPRHEQAPISTPINLAPSNCPVLSAVDVIADSQCYWPDHAASEMSGLSSQRICGKLSLSEYDGLVRIFEFVIFKIGGDSLVKLIIVFDIPKETCFEGVFWNTIYRPPWDPLIVLVLHAGC